MVRAPEPGNASERDLLLGWLAFHRDALAAKCDGLSAGQLVEASAPPSDLTMLGLVRHMTEMEHVYLVHALGGGSFSLVYCTDAASDGLTCCLPRRHRSRRARRAIGSSVRWNLIKVIQEYARHNGHADLVRERIDGATGE